MSKDDQPADAPNLDDTIFAGATGYDDLDEGPRPDTSETLPESAPEPEVEESAEVDEEAEDVEPEGAEDDAEADEADVAPTADAEGETQPEEQSKPDEPKSREPRIPKSRFDEVNERRKAAERRLAEIEKKNQADGGEAKIDFDFDAKEDEYMDAVLDGDKDKARSIRQEIRQAETQLYQQQMQQASTSTREATKAELELKSTVERLQAEYPVFDGNSDRYDQNLTEEALDLFEGFKSRGYDPATAMRRAVRYVVRANGLEDAADEADEVPAEKPTQHKAKPEEGKRKVKRAAKQPPQPSPRDVSDSADVMNMTEDEFDKLSDQELAKLRGDLI